MERVKQVAQGVAGRHDPTRCTPCPRELTGLNLVYYRPSALGLKAGSRLPNRPRQRQEMDMFRSSLIVAAAWTALLASTPARSATVDCIVLHWKSRGTGAPAVYIVRGCACDYTTCSF